MVRVSGAASAFGLAGGARRCAFRGSTPTRGNVRDFRPTILPKGEFPGPVTST
jgi:hypothetical protein